MRLIDSTVSSTPLPKLNFNSKATLSASAFDKILTDVQVVSEYVTIESAEKRLQFVGKGESGEVDIILGSGNEGLEEIIVKEESKSTYSLDYLSKISKA